jgi:F420-dependent oxidoreductase-like protein
MRLGLTLGYGGSGTHADTFALAQEADRLGYSVVWAAEAYGSDAATVLGWLCARTTRIDIGSAVFQIPGRTPALTAMTAATLDSLSGGRFRLGLGVSGPQVSEGWHGVKFASPLSRTREYIDIVRQILRREPLSHAGTHWTLPLQNETGQPVTALRLAMHPVRDHIPLYLAAVGPKNLELAGEIADGWLAVFFTPEDADEQRELLLHGRRRAAGADANLDGFDIVPTVPVVVGIDLNKCAEPVRHYAALYLGGMGSRDHNFYNSLAVRMGYAAAAKNIQDLYLAGDRVGAAAAVPIEFVDATSLIGSPERIADRVTAYAAAGVTTLTVAPYGIDLEQRLAAVRTMAEVVGV